MSKCKVWLMPTGKRDEIFDLFVDNDEEAIKKLIEAGDLIPIDAKGHKDSCGNIHATIEMPLNEFLINLAE